MSVGKRTRTGQISGPTNTHSSSAPTAGKRALTDEMSPRGCRVSSLRELIEAGTVSDRLITETIEYRAFTNSKFVWTWGVRMSRREAILACRLMLDDMRGGKAINWRMEAIGYVRQARAQLGTKTEAPTEVSEPVVMDGGTSPMEEPAVDGPLVSELETTSKPEVSEPELDEESDVDEQHDPGIAGRDLEDVARDARRLAEFLENQGSEHAKRAFKIADAISAGLVSLSMAAGLYLVTIHLADGKVLVVWTSGPKGPDFVRRAARVDRIVAQLEANLNELDKIKEETVPFEWVDEIYDNSTSQHARDYQAGAEGARSNLLTGQSNVPLVEGVRFDGWDGQQLIDRKWSITGYPDTKEQALKQSEALAKRGLTAVWEVPDAAQARRAQKLFDKLGITNITPRIAPP